jgi:hypothetical protein
VYSPEFATTGSYGLPVKITPASRPSTVSLKLFNINHSPATHQLFGVLDQKIYVSVVNGGKSHDTASLRVLGGSGGNEGGGVHIE